MTQAVSGQQTHKVTLTPYDAGDEWTTNILTSYYTDGKCHNKNQTIKTKNNRVRLRCVHESLTKCGVTFRLTYHQLALPPFSYLESSLHKSLSTHIRRDSCIGIL